MEEPFHVFADNEPYSSTKQLTMIDPRYLSPNLEQAIAEMLGICNLRPGSNSLFSHSSTNREFVIVERIWLARINPTFHGSGVLAFAMRSEELFVSKARNFRQKAKIAFAVLDKSLNEISSYRVMPVEFDPLQQLLTSFDMLPLINGKSRDGISYDLSVLISEFQVNLWFVNPETLFLKKIEEKLFELAAMIADRTSVRELREFTNAWRTYISNR